MKTHLPIILFMCSFSMNAQNSISFSLGEVRYTDWHNINSLQPGVEYDHAFSDKIKLAIGLNYYFFDRYYIYSQYPPLGYSEIKSILESNYLLEYIFNPDRNLNISLNGGLAMRYRIEGIVVASGMTGNGFNETVVRNYGGLEFGLSLGCKTNYNFSEKGSAGIYFQSNLYLPEEDVSIGDVTHKSPSAFSWGLSYTFNFIKSEKIK